MKKIVLTLVSLLFLKISVFAQTEVKFGLYINDLTLINKESAFYANVYWWCKIPISVNDSLVEEFSNIEFVNVKNDIDFKVTERTKKGKFYYVTGFCKGTFLYNPNFRKYPKDIHELQIIVESVNLPEETVVLVPDIESYDDENFQGFNREIKIEEFEILKSNFNKSVRLYNTSFGDPNFKINSNYSRITYTVVIERIYNSYLMKIIIPCLLLAIIAYLVFFIPANLLEVAVGCTVTSLLACIALQLTTTGDIPRLGYLTDSDLIYYLFYSLISLALIQTVYTYNLEKKGKNKLANRLEILGRYIYPLLLIVGILLILL